jgi:hypothetical protein
MLEKNVNYCTYVFYCDKKIICEKGFQDLRKSRQVHKQVE